MENKYDTLRAEAHANHMVKALESLYTPQDINMIVTIYQENYKVIYRMVDGLPEIQSIDGHSDIEDTFKDSFVTKVIDRIGEEIRAGKEYKGEMKSDESRGN